MSGVSTGFLITAYKLQCSAGVLLLRTKVASAVLQRLPTGRA